jgi:hypothetical protein
VLEFKHPFFQRDNPELLGQIRKIVNGSDLSGATCENSEIIALKSDVEELKVHLYMLSNKLVMLSQSVTQLLELKAASNLPPPPAGRLESNNGISISEDEEPSPKKRKTSSSSPDMEGEGQSSQLHTTQTLEIARVLVGSSTEYAAPPSSYSSYSSSSSSLPATSNKDKV